MNQTLRTSYKHGERSCPICGDPLPAHEVWPGAKYRYCMKPACKAQLVATKRTMRYVERDQVKCGAIGCPNYVPEGRYAHNPSVLTCSLVCANAPQDERRREVMCMCGCGESFVRDITKGTKEGFFKSYEHHGRYRLNRFVSENCGPFEDVLRKYLDGEASNRYRHLEGVRVSLVRFFEFLVSQGIASLDEVAPKTITAYIAWAKKTKSRDVACNLPYISVFFKWTLAMGYREGGNPVIGTMHYSKKKQRLPRPYTDEQMEFAWHLLHIRGNARLRFVMAIAEEAGLRIGEICRLQLSDIDIEAGRCSIGLPNKGGVPRSALFSEKTKVFFEEWMKERNPNCGHYFILHSVTSKPCSTQGLEREFRLVMCMDFRGEHIHDFGFEKWSTHRLRHTMATRLASGGADAATMMANGGWATFEAMKVYTEVRPDAVRDEYQSAVRRAQEEKQCETSTKILSPADLLARAGRKPSGP